MVSRSTLRLGTGVLQRAVVDRHPGVVAGRPRLGALAAEGEVGLGGAEHDTVEVVDPLALVLSRGDDAGEGLHEGLDGVEPHVPQLDEREHGLELDPQPGRVAEGSVGVGESPEEVCVLSLGARGDDIACAGEDVHLQDGLVRQAVAERRRLDAEAGHRPAQGDGPQLRDHERAQAVGQRRCDEVFVGAHAADLGRATGRLDRDHPVEPRDIEPGDPGAGAGTEEVGRLLGQADRSRRRDRAVALDEPLHGSPVDRGRRGMAQCAGAGTAGDRLPLRRHHVVRHTSRLGRVRCRRQALVSTGSPTLTCPGVLTLA